jgi:hypothetical protein
LQHPFLAFKNVNGAPADITVLDEGKRHKFSLHGKIDRPDDFGTGILINCTGPFYASEVHQKCTKRTFCQVASQWL